MAFPSIIINLIVSIFMFIAKNENHLSINTNNRINEHISTCKIDITNYDQTHICISKLYEDQLLLLIFKLSMYEPIYSQHFRDVYNTMIMYRYS